MEIEDLNRQFVTYNEQLNQMADAKGQLEEEMTAEARVWEVRIQN